MKLLLSTTILLLLIATNPSVAQVDSIEKSDQVTTPLSRNYRSDFLLDSLDSAIDYADSLGISGTVMVSFVVEKDGSVTNVEVVKGIDPILDSTARSVVENMPKWKPFMHNGKPIRVKQMLPIRFDR